MSTPVAMVYALRSLSRHLRRTLLSLIGVGVGCAIGMLCVSWIAGGAEMQIRAASESGAGHLKVVPEGWLETREDTLRVTDWPAVLAAARSLPTVASAVPRVTAGGLLALGNRNAGVMLSGVDPEQESAANRVVRRARFKGRYLDADHRGEVVLGCRLAAMLDARLGDELYLTLAGRNDITGAMLYLVGIAETGSREIDAAFCQVRWQDIQEWTDYPGVGEISILLHDPSQIRRSVSLLQQRLRGPNRVITWHQVNPAFAANIAADKAFSLLLISIIMVVVALGIASAQLTAVLERRREFGLLAALGMRRRHLLTLVLLEALVLGGGGGCLALLLGGTAAYWLATRGIDLAALMGGDASFAGILFDPILYGSFGIWVLWFALGVSILTTVLASLYPAWLATRVPPAEAMRMI